MVRLQAIKDGRRSMFDEIKARFWKPDTCTLVITEEFWVSEDIRP